MRLAVTIDLQNLASVSHGSLDTCMAHDDLKSLKRSKCTFSLATAIAGAALGWCSDSGLNFLVAIFQDGGLNPRSLRMTSVGLSPRMQFIVLSPSLMPTRRGATSKSYIILDPAGQIEVQTDCLQFYLELYVFFEFTIHQGL